MCEKKEQVKPLAPAALRLDVEEPDTFPVEFMGRRHRKCIKLCGCSAAIFLIIVTVILVLMFTVFHVKDPVLKMNSVTIQGLNVLNSSRNPRPGLNLTVEADVSIKNPNVASFKFSNTTTYVYYDGTVIGETRTPSGEARARRTLRMNVSIEVMVDKIMKVGRLKSDLVAGVLPISSLSKISGKVKITRAIKKGIVVKLECSMDANISSQIIQDVDCSRKISL